MSQLHGKQLRSSSTSLDKLNGSGIVSFENATMSFASGAVLRQADENINIGTDVVNKNYVDTVATGLEIKESVRVKSSLPITLSGTQTIDGFTLSVDDRVLVNNQDGATASPDNGIYVVQAGSWSRATDSDGDPNGEVSLGNFTFVEYGDTWAGTGWVLSISDTTTGTIEVGTQSQKWIQFSSAGVIQAGDGLTKTGNTLDVNLGTGLTFSNNNVIIDDTGVTASSYGSAGSVGTFTVNAQGQLTAAQDVTIDISASQVNDFDSASETAIFEDANFVDSDTVDFTVTAGESVTADVKIDGVTASGLTVSTNGISVNVDGVTIIVNNDGELEVDSSAVVPDVSNGLSIDNGDIVLGGTLSQDTTINGGSTHSFTIASASTILFGSEVFDVQAEGFVSIDAGTGSVQILADDAVTISASNSVNLVTNGELDLTFDTSSVTSVDGEGLVYSDDYTGTFVTNSLITKQYVDEAINNSTYFAGDGLELNGLTFSIDPASAGTGLTYASGVFNVNLGDGLTLSGDDITLDSTIAGTGLDYAAGILTVNTSEITSDLAGAGLTANGGELDILLDSDALEFNSSNEVSLKTTITGGRTFSNSVTIDDDLLVSGDFTVNGTTTFINTQELEVTDNIITLAKGNTAGSGLDAGIKVDRGTDPQARLLWDESQDLWVAGLTGSELALLTDVGAGLTRSGNVVSIDTTGFTGDLAGAGLTANGSQLDVNVANGLSIDSNNDVVLGGTLSVNTVIDADDNDFSIDSAGTIKFESDTFDVIANGLVSIDGGTGSVQIFADQAVTVYATGSIDLVTNGDLDFTFNSSTVTDASGASAGLVYADDYSAGFLPNSLITKQYVDDAVGASTFFAGDGLELNGLTFSIAPSAAGTGLTYSGGVFDVNLGDGLTLDGDDIVLDSTLAGEGLTYSNGVLDVNLGDGLVLDGDDITLDDSLAGEGLTYSNGTIDIITGSTESGLTFSNGELQVVVDNETIIINGNGELEVADISGLKSEPVYQLSTGVTSSGATYATGITLSATPSQYSRVQVFVNGLNIRVATLASNATSSPAYFQNGSIRDINDLDTSCQLIWNSDISGYQLEGSDEIEIVYEA